MSTINKRGTKLNIIQNALNKKGIMKACELIELGISREYLRKLTFQGILKKVNRGLYQIPDSDITAFHSFAEVSARIPHGVICLLSALKFHNITTQMPFEVWLAITEKTRIPSVPNLPIRIFRFSSSVYMEGIEEEIIEGVPVRVYSLAKTVADCFKYRNKIGLDIAIEALRESLRSKRITVDELWHYAKICRVTNVMRPYIEAMI